MELRPADLGNAFATSVVARRAEGKFEHAIAWLFRLFYRGQTGLSVKSVDSILRQITASVPLSRTFLFFACWVAGNITVQIPRIFQYRDYIQQSGNYGFVVEKMFWQFAISGIILLAFTTATFGQVLRKKFVAPLDYQEAYSFYQAQTAPTSRAYAHLVCDIIQSQHITPAAIAALRDAICSLGEAANAISATQIPQANVQSLRYNALLARERASSETDLVIKAALIQEADAHEAAADAAKQNALTAKRIDALKDTLVAQMEALRLTLPAFQMNNTGIPHLLSLSERIGAVAAQASAITSAHAELNGTAGYDRVAKPILQPVGTRQ
ncbi:MAG: hypothetical protein H8F28_04090 [Fibrella sp.]|nr:hypothetical protein [Armatimonadota bacterium]